MFCPNCGTQNDSAATPCKKCGFKLSGISVPKFKGTMMLNSDQTVAEMIEEHRKKQVQGGTADKAKARPSEPPPRRNPGSSAPPSSLGGPPRGPVLQPPRAAAPTRGRMGGTMLGVAPQVGGHAPPPATPAVPGGSPLPTAPRPADVPSTEPPRSDAVARSEAAPATPAPAPATPTPAPAAPARAVAETVEAPARQAPVDGVAPPRDAEPAAPATPTPAAAASDGERRADDPGDAAPEPAPARAVAATAPLPRMADAREPSPSARPADTRPPAPSRVTPLDIVLIVFTFGIYGIVLWAKRRKPAA